MSFTDEEVDRLLRGGVFVDLYRVVRQGLRASVESYSIKKIERLYDLSRIVDLKDANSSIAEFEEWLQLPQGERPGAHHLEKIREYNRDDVVSTWRLRDWLEARRAELIAAGTAVPLPPHPLRAGARQRRDHHARRRGVDRDRGDLRTRTAAVARG